MVLSPLGSGVDDQALNAAALKLPSIFAMLRS